VLSEQGRGVAWHVLINSTAWRGTAWACHDVCELAFRGHWFILLGRGDKYSGSHCSQQHKTSHCMISGSWLVPVCQQGLLSLGMLCCVDQ
jgi:hypothetical protein